MAIFDSGLLVEDSFFPRGIKKAGTRMSRLMEESVSTASSDAAAAQQQQAAEATQQRGRRWLWDGGHGDEA